MTQLPPPIPLQVAGTEQKNRLAVWGLVLGIFSVFIPVAGMLLAMVGIVISGKALARKTLAGQGMAAAGMTLCILGWLAQLVLMLTLLPPLTNARELTKSARCAMNLSQIGKAIAIYGAAHNDRFPPNLDVLLKDGSLTAETLHCPAHTSAGCSYFYRAPDDDEIGSGTIIICDVAFHSRKYRVNNTDRNYLRADLSVQRSSESGFPQLLQQPENRRFAEELAKGVTMTPQERVTYTAPRDGK